MQLQVGGKKEEQRDRGREVGKEKVRERKGGEKKREKKKPRSHSKKQRHHFLNKGLYSQSYGFPSSHMGLDHKEG